MSEDDKYSNPQYISRVTTNNVRNLIDKTAKAMFRDRTGNDIGIDGEVELINLTAKEQIPTGNIALIQFKGTKSKIEPLQTKNVISIRVENTTINYVNNQQKIPVILIYSSMQEEDDFYFLDLHKAFEEQIKGKKSSKSYTLNIPCENRFSENSELFFRIINGETY